jgi:hypothetical protein
MFRFLCEYALAWWTRNDPVECEWRVQCVVPAAAR